MDSKKERLGGGKLNHKGKLNIVKLNHGKLNRGKLNSLNLS